MSANACLDENQLLRLSQGKLEPSLLAKAELHLSTCESCRQTLVVIARALSSPSMSSSEPETGPSPAETGFGRYARLELLGAGAHGVVYSAQDSVLDRRVALKLLAKPDGADAALSARLVREAKALAKLAHPHVVAVFDAGEIDGRLFIAMELVEGTTLSDWLRESARPWREVVALFVQAGQGLAAAHQAGVIHRDFKPHNVLLGKDGRVRVADFGLARLEGGAPVQPREHSATPLQHPALSPVQRREDAATEPPPLESVSPEPPPPLETVSPAPRDEDSAAPSRLEVPGHVARDVSAAHVTRTRTLVGTPAYMAPEQFRGAPADAASDQFSFCVALYEALYGVRPFLAETARGLLETIERGAPERPPRSSIPKWLHALVLKGLSARPQDRHASVDALVRAISRKPNVPRRLLALGGSALLLWGVGHFAHVRWRKAQCEPPSLGGVWDSEARGEIERAFLATRGPFSADAWRGASRALDDYTASWSNTRREVCEASRVRGEETPEATARKTACLDLRLLELEELTRLFRRADAATVESAVFALLTLRPPSSCNDPLTASSEEQAAGPTSAERAKLRRALAHVGALAHLGQYEPGVTAATEAAKEAARLGAYEGEALFLLGDLLDRAGKSAASATLRDAFAKALGAKDDRIAFKAASALVMLEGRERSRSFEERHEWAKVARAFLDRGLGDPLWKADLLAQEAMLDKDEGNPEPALAKLRESLRLRIEELGPQHVTIASALNNLSIAANAAGKTDEAISSASRALEITERALGAHHPQVAKMATNGAEALRAAHRCDEATALLRRALEINESIYGPSSPRVAEVLLNLGAAADDSGKPLEAIPLYERALGLYAKDGSDYDRALVFTNLGNSLAQSGRREEAVQRQHHALELFEKSLGAEHPTVATAAMNQAETLGLLGKHAEALALYRRAFDIRRKRLSSNHPLTAEAEASIGQSLLALHQRDAARTALQNAVNVWDKNPFDDPEGEAHVRFVLAQLLPAAQGKPLANQALTLYRKSGASAATRLAEVERWLSQRH